MQEGVGTVGRKVVQEDVNRAQEHSSYRLSRHSSRACDKVEAMKCKQGVVARRRWRWQWR